MSKRAEDVEHTRRRIVDAAVQLHGTVGPAATSIAAIAQRAGVTRLTVYRHFPDDAALFTACSSHWLAQQDPPRPQNWAAITDDGVRLRAGLADLYRFYRDAEQMLTLVARDAHAVPEPIRQRAGDREVGYVDTLIGVGPLRNDRIRRAVIGHAVAFTTWQSLCRAQGLTDDEAVETMATLVEAVGERGGHESATTAED
ncbi:MAG: TetR/AcrR family transcriptional regulator [Catenulispora sp.]|nr:TetR/AcrR family transcriptional regulator [Catenulispora sp.]